MDQTTQVFCPNCSSNQLTANKKGFSGKKAVGGALLTGGIGLLAGTIGSNKIKITCLACGHEFKPGDGKTQRVSMIKNELKENLIDDSEKAAKEDPIDKRILEIAKQHGKLAAVGFCRDAKNCDLKIAKEYVEDLISKNGTSDVKEGCFIATACYGDYDSMEVIILRKYRDQILLNNTIGIFFVRLYYCFSPSLAKAISKSDRTKTFIRLFFLNPTTKIIQRTWLKPPSSI